MKKINLILTVVFLFLVCNIASAFTTEIDPSAPLTDYISMGEWNTPGDFEDWTTLQLINTSVADGNLYGVTTNNDPNISLNMSGLPATDARSGHATISGTVLEFRLQFETNTQNASITLFPTINYLGPGVLTPFVFSGLPTNGAFHIYRITLEADDTNHHGIFQGIRLDMLENWGPTGEFFKIDYFRIANVITTLKVDPDPIFNYTSLAEWNTDNDFENWIFNGIGSSNVSSGIMSGSILNADPHFYKTSVPQVDLDNAPIVEFRIKQTAELTSEMEIFFGATDDPNFGGSTRTTIPVSAVPTDGEFHVYQYNMSTLDTWKKELLSFRIDPYVVAEAIGKTFEIDYIRVGNAITPTVNPSASEGTYANKVVVSWDNNPIITKYQVWRNTTNDSSTATIVLSDITSDFFDDTTATPEVFYYYWVKAFIIGYWGDFGESAFGFATASTGPYTPSNISPSADSVVSDFPIILKGSDYSDEYNWPMEAVEWKLAHNSGFSPTKWKSGILLSDSTSIEPPSSVIGTQNYWKVRYKNSRDKWSDWSTATKFEFTLMHNTNAPYYFYDTFNATGNGDVNNNYYRAGRQFGSVAPLNYTISGQSEVGSEVANPYELMLGESSGVSPNYSFTDSGSFKIEFDVVPHALDKQNDWVSLTFGKEDQSDFFPISLSGAGLIFFGNTGFQGFDGTNMVGTGWGVSNEEKLHIILTANIDGYDPEYGFDYDPVQYSVFVNGIPMLVSSATTGYVFNDVNGFDDNYVSLYSHNSVSPNTSLFDNLKISEVKNSVSITNWISDAEMLPMNPAKTTHAVNLNGDSVTINGVDFIGTGTNFGAHANGSSVLKSNGWELIGSDGAIAFHNEKNITNLVSDSGTRTLMEYFALNSNAMGLKLSDLSPFSTNVISFYSYGWEDGGRTVYFSSSSGGTIFEVDQDEFGKGYGIIVRYSYIADKDGKCTIVLSRVIGGAWHLSGFYSEEISAPAAQIDASPKLDFGDIAVGDTATLQLEIGNLGAGNVDGSISGASTPFSLGSSYSSTAATSDIIEVTFTPDDQQVYSQTITLTGTSGGNADVTLTGTGIPEPLTVIGYLLSIIGLFFARRKI